MIYIYDTVIARGQTELRRYGANYKLTHRHKMDKDYFYTFTTPGRETILVVPRFAMHYNELAEKTQRLGHGKSLEAYIKAIKKNISESFTLDEFVNNDSVTGTSTIIYVDCGDIQITYEYYNNELHLSDEFEIIRENLFGNGIVVLMNVNMEE